MSTTIRRHCGIAGGQQTHENYFTYKLNTSQALFQILKNQFYETLDILDHSGSRSDCKLINILFKQVFYNTLEGTKLFFGVLKEFFTGAREVLDLL